MAESEEELKNLLIKVKEEGEKVVLKLSVQNRKIIASGPITLWQIDGETVETVTDFIFEDSKITVDGDCSHEIKRHMLLGRKVMTNLLLLLLLLSRFSRVRLCATLNGSLPGSAVPGILQARTLEWAAISFSNARQHIKRQHIILSTKFCLVKAMVYPVVMYGCESRTIKKAEH